MNNLKVKMRKFLLALFILIPAFYLLPATCCFAADKYVRVAIIRDAESIRLYAKCPYDIVDLRDKKTLSSGKFLNANFSCSKSGIIVDGINYSTDRISVEIPAEEIAAIADRKYRGNIRLIKKDNLHLLAVNDIRLEDYVKGILYHEVSHYWPQEVLKAQAIVCRTYALYQAKQSAAQDYDVTNDIYSQVYGGKDSERYRTNKAVDDTRVSILTYFGQIFPAYFHATCAGYTEKASTLWNIDLPPLRGVACDFCRQSPHFNWHRVIALDELKDILIKAGKDCGDIKVIKVLDRNLSGRVTELKIVTDKNDLQISAKDFRNIIGPNIIKSTNFTVDIAGKDAVFEGTGWGHGVGMCQWGAYFMAKGGRNYQEILKYYYPGAELAQY